MYRGSEAVSLKLCLLNHNKSFLIGAIYRHPNRNANDFIEDFAETLGKLASENTISYILGEMNININENHQELPQSKKYKHALTSSGAVLIFTKPTRVTDNSATVIDHIITNDVSHDITPRIICSLMTDHFSSACKINKT